MATLLPQVQDRLHDFDNVPRHWQTSLCAQANIQSQSSANHRDQTLFLMFGAGFTGVGALSVAVSVYRLATACVFVT
jgi:hypothetical protein